MISLAGFLRAPPGLSATGRWRSLNPGQIHGSGLLAHIHEVGHTHAENLRQLAENSQGRIATASLQLLVVAVRDPAGGHILLRETTKPAGLAQVLPEPLEEDREIHAIMMAACASLIEPTEVACFTLLASSAELYPLGWGKVAPHCAEEAP